MKRLNYRNMRQLGQGGACVVPCRAIQFGEGNFIRAFIEPMLQVLADKGYFDGSVVIIKPRTGNNVVFREQDGLYTLIERGIEQGQTVSRTRLIKIVSQCLQPESQGKEFLELSHVPSCRFVFSNTTESGLRYGNESWDGSSLPKSFPARLTVWLFERFKHFQGATDKGMVMIPCELVYANGEVLRSIVKHHAEDWKLPVDFLFWLEHCCRWINTLVDRIVPGFPYGEEEVLWNQLGYEDRLMVSTEPYSEFVLESSGDLENELPFQKCGLPVVYADNLTPWYLRKIRLLNALHTSCVPLGRLLGFVDIRGMMLDAQIFGYMKSVLEEELLPSLDPLPPYAQMFASKVLERFCNPFSVHRLTSITLNCIDKWNERVLPAILDYRRLLHNVPVRLARSWAAMVTMYWNLPVEDSLDKIQRIRAYQTGIEQGGVLSNSMYQLLADRNLWKEDLCQFPDLVESLQFSMEEFLHGDFLFKFCK